MTSEHSCRCEPSRYVVYVSMYTVRSAMRLKTSGSSARGIKRHIVLRTCLRFGGGAAVAVIMSALVIVENARTYVYKRLHVMTTITVIYVGIYRYIYDLLFITQGKCNENLWPGRHFLFYLPKKSTRKLCVHQAGLFT